MAHFRLEAEEDGSTGLFWVEVFYPAESATPFITTHPRFVSKEAAFQEAMALMEEAFNKPVSPLIPN